MTEIFNAERVDLTTKTSKDRYIKDIIKIYSLNMRFHIKAIFDNYCMKYPSDYDYHFLKSKRNEINISDEQVVELCYARLMATKSSVYADRYVSLMIDLLPTFNEVKAKTYLKALNRKFSPMLISDKAKWEPIIAKIRTALDTY